MSLSVNGIEDGVFLRGEVAKEGAARNLGGGGQIVDRHLVEAMANTDEVKRDLGTDSAFTAALAISLALDRVVSATLQT